MLQPNPYTRISAKDALIHPYFKDLPQEVLKLYKKWLWNELNYNKFQAKWSQSNIYKEIPNIHSCII